MKSKGLAPLLVCVALGTAACGGAEASSSGDGGDERVIGYSNPQGSQVSLQSIAYGAEQAIEQLDVPWTVNEIDAKVSGDKQVSDIDTMIAQQVDGIASWTLNSGAMEPAYARATAAGIPVFGLNSESPSVVTNIKTETDSTCIVGEEQAAFIAERTPNARVLAVFGPEIPSITFTGQCFRDAAAAAGLTIVDEVTDTTMSEASGQAVAEPLLAANRGTFDAVWVFSDQTGVGVSAALMQEGVDIWTETDKSGVVVVSRDGAASAAENVKRGVLSASWDGNFPEIGAAVAQLLHQHYVDGVALEDLPEEVVIPATRYDSTNIDDYEGELERAVDLPLDD
jgi:ribose transport system substrate-binding protein